MKFTDLEEYQWVHCSSEDQAVDLLNHLKETGVKWASGNSLADYTMWYEYKENTCYSFWDCDALHFSSIESAILLGREIIEFEDLDIAKTSSEPIKEEDLKLLLTV